MLFSKKILVLLLAISTPVFATSKRCNNPKTEIAKAREQFQTAYRQKEYKKAFDTLEFLRYQSSCKITSQEELWIMNDLMLTAVKLKNFTRACVEIKTEILMKSADIATSHDFKNAFTNVSRSCEGDYFGVLDQIESLPPDAAGILVLNEKESEKIISLLDEEDPNLKMHSLNEARIYKGDFSNRGQADYAVVFDEGSGHYNSVLFYKFNNEKLIKMDTTDTFDKIFLEGDGIGKAIGFIKDNKVYIRKMRFPKNHNYDPSVLRSCIYLWEKDKIKLVGPNFRGTWPEYRTIETKACEPIV